MKHSIGYGVLIVALIGTFLWGNKQGEVPKVGPLLAAHHPDPLEIDLRDKHPDKYRHEVTDHAQDYADDVNKLIWKTSEKFEVDFDQGSTPCSDKIVYTDDGNGHFQASCTVIPSTTTAKYYYSIYFPNKASYNPNGGVITSGGVRSCDGCFIDLQ